MGENAESIIKDAFSLLTIRAAEEPLESTDAQLAIRVLNRMMAALAARGINLGFTEIENLSSEMTVPDGALDPITAILAQKLQPHYFSTPIQMGLAISISEGMRTLIQMAIEVGETEVSGNLPCGSGIDTPDNTQHFFTGNTDTDISPESSGAIIVESDT